jgi:hypothetical protein
MHGWVRPFRMEENPLPLKKHLSILKILRNPTSWTFLKVVFPSPKKAF